MERAKVARFLADDGTVLLYWFQTKLYFNSHVHVQCLRAVKPVKNILRYRILNIRNDK